ncbi:MAG: hypothetical protein M0R33_13850 [Methylomonas sp.]|jgi:hypothetical protein|uniref:hypothetical protein n=1 Tax=Methylomonas sp. TaxID=418 RepID=UPI0025D8098E|nr:hypothetical protein [Methylomonas sp.]MCK9607519.1 hypothetical protein [Methylomonas sp.]
MKRVADTPINSSPAAKQPHSASPCATNEKRTLRGRVFPVAPDMEQTLAALNHGPNIFNPLTSVLVSNLEKYECIFDNPIDFRLATATSGFAYRDEINLLLKNQDQLYYGGGKIFRIFGERQKHCRLANMPDDAAKYVKDLLIGKNADYICNCVINAVSLYSCFPRIIAAFPIGIINVDKPNNPNLFPSDILTATLLDETIQEPEMVKLRQLLSKPIYSLCITIQSPCVVPLLKVPVLQASPAYPPTKENAEALQQKIEWRALLKKQIACPQDGKSATSQHIQKIREICGFDGVSLFGAPSALPQLSMKSIFDTNFPLIEKSKIWAQIVKERNEHTLWKPEMHGVNSIEYVAKLFGVSDSFVCAIISAGILIREYPRIIIACNWNQEENNFLFDKKFVVDLLGRKKDEEMMEVAHLLAKPLPAGFFSEKSQQPIVQRRLVNLSTLRGDHS